jgi:hypothetical protein
MTKHLINQQKCRKNFGNGSSFEIDVIAFEGILGTSPDGAYLRHCPNGECCQTYEATNIDKSQTGHNLTI